MSGRAGSLSAFALAKAALAALLAASLAGCAGPALSNLAPGERGAINTGTYPNLNVAPPMATDQFTDNTLQDHVATTAAARQSQIASGKDDTTVRVAAAADQARLQQVRQSQDAILKSIETAH